ncbi:TPA: hypothetical protein ACGOW9_001396 [Streptococcus suis]|nr:hypothetical protein [Streptococcus suis]
MKRLTRNRVLQYANELVLEIEKENEVPALQKLISEINLLVELTDNIESWIIRSVEQEKFILTEHDFKKLMNDLLEKIEKITNEKLKEKLQKKLVFAHEENHKNINSQNYSKLLRKQFAKLYSILVKYQDESIHFSDDMIKLINNRFGTERNGFVQVFLSHAYLDRLYTLGLFKFFYDKGVYLYIDWMHNTASNQQNVVPLKQLLGQELDNSNQLLFLRTINSELSISGGNHQVRQWCSWEIGYFEKSKGLNSQNNKLFYIDAYIDETIDEYYYSNNHKSFLINNFNLFRNVQNGNLV